MSTTARECWMVPMLLTAVTGCGTVDLGRGSEFLWWTDHETGDLSDWEGDKAGYHWTAQGGTLDLVTEPTRSGRFALRSTVTASIATTPSSALVARNARLSEVAYYSAWYFVPETVALTDYWLVFRFRSRTNPTNPATTVELWDLDFMPLSETEMRFQLYRHGLGIVPPLVSPEPTVPLTRWFQIEAFLRAVTDATGQLTIWIDGTKVFEVTNTQTLPSQFLEWSVGGSTGMKSLTQATLYIDDAAISTKRLGPEFPVFSRE